MSDNEFVYKPQDVNYLGFLEAQLRDMTGMDTLAYELIQNADDVREEDGRFAVTTLSFDITDEALIVSNDGRFRPVDFERLQNIAGGGKRDETGVTGAFGLGFLAVYQITDAPEILSSGRHWFIHPDAPSEQRIKEQRVETSGTRFRLPWAFDPTSRVRRTLHLEAIRPEQLDTIARQMAEAITLAALFLQRLQQMEVKRNGLIIRRVERQREGDRLLLTDEAGHLTEWLLLSGDFDAVAQRLRQQYPWQIEERRHSRVQMALPISGELRSGRLYAGLPTADTLPLACYLNADFFPTTDRKRVHFDSGYQTAWNEAAVTAAAATLADELIGLPRMLPPTGLWRLLQSAAEAASQAQQGELPTVFAAFWQALLPRLPQTPIFYTAAGAWLPPTDGRVLPPSMAVAPETIIPLLQGLQLTVLHSNLTGYASLMHRIGTPFLTVTDIASGLHRAGLTRATPLPEAPPFLRSMEAWQPLWTLLDILMRGLPPVERESALAELNHYATALSERMMLRPLTQLYRRQTEAQALFPNIAWLHPALSTDSFPGRYVSTFGARQAVTFLAEMPIDLLEEAWRVGELDIPRLFRWFEAQQIEIFAEDPTLAKAIRRLPLCPVDGHLRPLADLFLPGGFNDPLQIAGLVDVNALGGRRQFLRDLGVQTLDFETYLHVHLPRVMAQQPDLPSDGRYRLLHLLAKRLGEFRDDEVLQAQLSQLPLIPCLDGSFRPALFVYLSRQNFDQLGVQVHVAEPVESLAQQALYEWLYVRKNPAVADLIQALLAAGRKWNATPLTAPILTAVVNCWQALTERLESGEIAADALAQLRSQPVVPNGHHRLTVPEEMLLADQPALAEKFAQWAPFFLPTDVMWSPAAIAAGVRPLSQAVTWIVVAGHEAVADTAVQERILTRYTILERLLRAETAAGHTVEIERLHKVKVMTLPHLRVQAQLHLGVQVEVAEAESVSAKWMNGVLYLDREQLPIPWTAVARELAQAIAPRRKVGSLALGIKEILAAETTADAAAMMDELGYQ